MIRKYRSEHLSYQAGKQMINQTAVKVNKNFIFGLIYCGLGSNMIPPPVCSDFLLLPCTQSIEQDKC